MASYKVKYLRAEAQPSDTVMVDVRVLASYDEGTTWEVLPGGDTKLGVPASDILTITQDTEMTAAQKLGALNQMLLDRINDLGLTASRDAVEEMEALLPQGWPIEVTL